MNSITNFSTELFFAGGHNENKNEMEEYVYIYRERENARLR